MNDILTDWTNVIYGGIIYLTLFIFMARFIIRTGRKNASGKLIECKYCDVCKRRKL